ncbi:DUF6887 family protein [Trichothermofontia sp.]
MKPDFDKMGVADLHTYVLSHRHDLDAIRALFLHPSLQYRAMPPLSQADGTPILENIRSAEEAIRQQFEESDQRKK